MADKKKDGRAPFDWILISALSLASIVAPGLLDLTPSDPRNGVAVVFAPWVASAEAVTRAASAGATVVHMGRYPFIVVVRPRLADYRRRAVADGAWVVLDIQSPGGCFTRKAHLS